jgi:hypothetical protein
MVERLLCLMNVHRSKMRTVRREGQEGVAIRYQATCRTCHHPITRIAKLRWRRDKGEG